jgi:hypothetical protein
VKLSTIVFPGNTKMTQSIQMFGELKIKRK